MKKFLNEARKTGVTILGIVAAVASQGMLPDPEAKWAAVIVALATALGVYHVPNVTEKTPVEGK